MEGEAVVGASQDSRGDTDAKVFLLQTKKTLHHSGNSPGHYVCTKPTVNATGKIRFPPIFPRLYTPISGLALVTSKIRNSTPNDLTARPTADHRSTPRPVTQHRPRHWPISRHGRDTGVWFGRAHQSGFQNLSVLWLKIKKMNEKKTSRFLRFGRERKDLILRKRAIHSNTILEREETHTQHAGDGNRQFHLIFIFSLLCTNHWPQRQSKPLFFNQAKIKNQSSFVSLWLGRWPGAASFRGGGGRRSSTASIWRQWTPKKLTSSPSMTASSTARSLSACLEFLLAKVTLKTELHFWETPSIFSSMWFWIWFLVRMCSDGCG